MPGGELGSLSSVPPSGVKSRTIGAELAQAKRGTRPFSWHLGISYQLRVTTQRNPCCSGNLDVASSLPSSPGWPLTAGRGALPLLCFPAPSARKDEAVPSPSPLALPGPGLAPLGRSVRTAGQSHLPFLGYGLSPTGSPPPSRVSPRLGPTTGRDLGVEL